MTWRLAASPPAWYVAFWTAAIPVLCAGVYLAVKWGGIAAGLWLRHHPEA